MNEFATQLISIEAAVLSNGYCPFESWFFNLIKEEQFLIEHRLSRVRLGNFGQIRGLGGGLHELNFYKGRAIRVYFCWITPKSIALLIGGHKDTQQKDIKKAIIILESFRKKR